MLNDGTTDQVKYKTCSCDTSVYTDATKCSNNQTEEASCTDEKRKSAEKVLLQSKQISLCGL